MIKLEELTKRFGPIMAVDGVSLSVERGEVMGFLGPNGAGKTTTMRMITGFLAPTSGRALVGGHDVALDPIVVKKQIGYLPEGAPLYGDMTPLAFLDFIAAARGVDGSARKQAVERAVAMLQLEAVAHRPVDTLSKGFKRRVGLAQAIIHDPDVLILDEPTDGLDPNQKHQVRTLIAAMAHDKAIIISTHILEEVEAVCSRAVIIATGGRVVFDGTPDALQRKSGRHNAVLVQIARQDVDRVRAAIMATDGVERVEEEPGKDDSVVLVAVSADGRPILHGVSDGVRNCGADIASIQTDRGDLSEVFRQLTAS